MVDVEAVGIDDDDGDENVAEEGSNEFVALLSSDNDDDDDDAVVVLVGGAAAEGDSSPRMYTISSQEAFQPTRLPSANTKYVVFTGIIPPPLLVPLP